MLIFSAAQYVRGKKLDQFTDGGIIWSQCLVTRYFLVIHSRTGTGNSPLDDTAAWQSALNSCAEWKRPPGGTSPESIRSSKFDKRFLPHWTSINIICVYKYIYICIYHEYHVIRFFPESGCFLSSPWRIRRRSRSKRSTVFFWAFQRNWVHVG